MNKNEIYAELMKHDSSVLSFPNRGSWGDSRWRGNCSGWIHAFLAWKYKVERMAELFAGSGTGYDVCKDMGIDYAGYDLNPSPVRSGIFTLNAITDEVPAFCYSSDMIFMHPPYGKEIGIPYARSMFPDPTGELSKSDLGQMEWPLFMRTLNEIIMKYFSAMDTGARMAILMGDVRRKGHFYSMLADICKPGNLEQIIIKCQHNCVSDGRTYSSKDFVPIVHEYIMVIRKMMPYIINFTLPREYSMDIRDSGKGSTWKDIVASVMRNFNRPASLNEIYAEIENHKKTETNPNWKAKVRQILETSNLFRHVSTGVWAVA